MQEDTISKTKEKIDKRVQKLEYYESILMNVLLRDPNNEEIEGLKNYIQSIMNVHVEIRESLSNIDKYVTHFSAITNAFKETTPENIIKTLKHNIKFLQVDLKDYIPLKPISEEDLEMVKDFEVHLNENIDKLIDAIDNNPLKTQYEQTQVVDNSQTQVEVEILKGNKSKKSKSEVILETAPVEVDVISGDEQV